MGSEVVGMVTEMVSKLRLDRIRLIYGNCSEKAPTFWVNPPHVNGKTVASVGVLLTYDDVCITYRHKTNKDYWSDEAYTVDLEWTDCHYGGQRPWFQCPNRCCGKRVAILYISGSIGCRQCQGLVYESQRENVCNRSSRAADKLRDRLGWKRGFLHGEGYRPKGMHRATFERLASSHQQVTHNTLKDIAERFNLI